jgi:Carboxypeptidase regulatory-like domain
MNEYPQPGLHPGADTLSAFVEGVLPEHERLACLGHFAECAACREVVYLAQEPLPREAVPDTDKVVWWKHWVKPISALSAAALAGVLVVSIAHYRLEKPAPNMLRGVVADSAPQAASDPPGPTIEAPHITTPRAGRKTSTIVPRSVSVQVPSRPEALLTPPQPDLPQDSMPRSVVNLALLVNGAIDAQSAITGTVTDPTGAAIAGAAVTVRQASGAPGPAAMTDKSGRFLIVGLRPGQYELQVTQSGFQTATKKVEIQSGQLARADSSLSLGSTAQTVEVTASSAVVDTQTANLVTNFSGVMNEPLPGRTVANKSAPSVSDSVSLPSKLAAVATATKGKVILAADSAGTLYRSDNAGKKWKAVKAVWQGKIVELAAGAAEFRLTTDMGIAWLSRDGSRWHSAPPPKR